MFYRIRQFGQALAAGSRLVAPPELGAGLRELFLRLPPADRAHALRTYRLLASVEGQPVDLLIAALLHDAGKCGPQVHLWDRVLFVLAGRLAPTWLERLPEAPGASRWAGLVALQSHAERGARLAAAAGAAPRVVSLIRHHHAAPATLGWPEDERRLLQRLQEADESS